MQGQLGRQTRALRFSAIYSFIVNLIAGGFFVFGGTASALAALAWV
jgi:hypothetical protein